MFIDSPKLIKLADKAVVYKNFVSPEECAAIVAELESDPNRRWGNTEHYEENNEVTSFLQVVSGSMNVLDLHERLSSFVAPEFEPLPSNSINRLLPGQSLKPHWDSPGEDEAESVTAYDPYGTCHMVKWGTVMYFSEFEGGELYYPHQGVQYKPEAGDLVIHSAFEDYLHGVREVTSGVRYVYSTFLIEKGRAPLPDLQKLSVHE